MSKEENEKSESVHKKKIKVKKVSRQENKIVVAERRFELLIERSDGILQSLIIAWNGDSIVKVIIYAKIRKNLQLSFPKT